MIASEMKFFKFAKYFPLYNIVIITYFKGWIWQQFIIRIVETR